MCRKMMGVGSTQIWFLMAILIFKLLACCLLGFASAKEVYVVYSGSHGDLLPEQVTEMHHSMLVSVKGSAEEAKESLVYSYRRSFNGFAAHLSSEEASAISGMKGVVSVFPSKRNKMHTTRSWAFLGMAGDTHGDESADSNSLWKKANYGEGMIIGLLDSGIWPESESFRDDGLSAVPSTWKGICQEGEAFNTSHCNKKLIGARYYLKGYEAYYGPQNTTQILDYRSPRDKDGHGTHTSSIAAGREVNDASALGGYAIGRASGGASRARLAIYKVCWPIPGGDIAGENTCTDADMLAAIDDALDDGVNVLSISIGSSGKPEEYTRDAIALGSLHAVNKGVIVACSAGNEGPKLATTSNLAPWIITVAANSVDRDFPSPVLLGDGTQVKPDITAPGLNILAAWSGAASPTKLLVDERRVKYNILSGTSMSCPHIAGISTLLKIIHPEWSPSAIKSALMTTAIITNNEGHLMTDASGYLATPFSYGSGQVNPNQALDPGLLYDNTIEDYLMFLCSNNINASNILDTNFKCPEIPTKASELNYPSVAIINSNNTEIIKRTVTNVGEKSEYIVSIDVPQGVSIDIFPNKLTFQSIGEKQNFTIKFTPHKPLNNEYVFGSYTWNDGVHRVNSPIVIIGM